MYFRFMVDCIQLKIFHNYLPIASRAPWRTDQDSKAARFGVISIALPPFSSAHLHSHRPNTMMQHQDIERELPFSSGFKGYLCPTKRITPKNKHQRSWWMEIRKYRLKKRVFSIINKHARREKYKHYSHLALEPSRNEIVTCPKGQGLTVDIGRWANNGLRIITSHR